MLRISNCVTEEDFFFLNKANPNFFSSCFLCLCIPFICLFFSGGDWAGKNLEVVGHWDDWILVFGPQKIPFLI